MTDKAKRVILDGESVPHHTRGPMQRATAIKAMLIACCLLCPQLLWAIAPPNAFVVCRDEKQFLFFNVDRNELMPTVFGMTSGWDAGEGDPRRQKSTLRYPQEWWCLCRTGENYTKRDHIGYGAALVDADGVPITPAVLFAGDWLYWEVWRQDGGCFVHALTNFPPRDDMSPDKQCRLQYITPNKEVLDNLNFPLVSDGTNRFLYDLRIQRKWPTDIGPDEILGAKDDLAAKLPRGAVCVRKNGRWGLIDYSGVEVLPCVHDEIHPLYSRNVDAYEVKDGKTLGLCRSDGSWIVPPGNFSAFKPTIGWAHYAWWNPRLSEVVFAKTNDELVGLVRLSDGQWLISPIYNDIGELGFGAAMCKKDERWGVVSFAGEPLTEFVFTSIELHMTQYKRTVGVWKATLPDGSKRTVTELGTICGEKATFLMAGNALLCCDGGRVFAVADPENGIQFADGVSASFLGASLSTNVLIRVDRGGLCGLYDFTRRREVTALVYKHAVLAENMIRAANAERTDVFSLDGELLCSFSDHAVFPKNFRGDWYEWKRKDFTFIDGIGPVLDGARAGLLDTNGVLRLPMVYEDMGAYHEGVAPAKRDGLWGYVDLDGNWVIPPKYEAAEAFVNGHAAVRLGGKVGIVTRDGEVAAPFVYEEVGYVYKGMFPAQIGGKWGVFGLDGQTKLPPEYTGLEWIDIRDPRVPTRYHGKCEWREEI